jgi:hypothetical protein
MCKQAAQQLCVLSILKKPFATYFLSKRMMENLSPIQQLDLILGSLDNYSKSINEIQKELNLEIKSSIYQDVRMILEKLVDDKYAKEIRQENTPPDVLAGIISKTVSISYKLTFEGKVFKEQGGYNEKERTENINIRNLETETSLRKRNEKVTSISAAFAAVATTLYLLFELGKYFHWW